MTSKDNQKKQAYISPAMEVVDIEMQQSILAGSYEPEETQVEKIGKRNEDMDWGSIW